MAGQPKKTHHIVKRGLGTGVMSGSEVGVTIREDVQVGFQISKNKRVMFVGICLSAALIGCGVGTNEGTSPDTSGAPVEPDNGIKDGTFTVPGQMKPGKYESVVPEDSWGCYYERLKSSDGAFGSIISNGMGNPNEQVRVTIEASDKYFKTEGCGAWAPEK